MLRTISRKSTSLVWAFSRSRGAGRGAAPSRNTQSAIRKRAAGLGQSGAAAIRNPQSAIRNWVLAVVAAAVVLAACSIEPQPIHLGSEECSHCRMIITDREFAAQALNTKGRAFSFDAIECLAEWVRAGEAVPAAELHSLWVSDFGDSENWIAAEDAGLYRDALGVAPPAGVPAAFLEPVARPFETLLHRWARTHGPFRTVDVAGRFGLALDQARLALEALAAEDRLIRGGFTAGLLEEEWVEPEEETEASAEVFRDLRLRKSEQPLEPLFTGEWR
jgi:hypothetical protein